MSKGSPPLNGVTNSNRDSEMWAVISDGIDCRIGLSALCVGKRWLVGAIVYPATIPVLSW